MGHLRSQHRLIAGAVARAEQLRPIMEELSKLSARQAAAVLNERKVPATGGGRWHSAQVIRLRKRLAASERVDEGAAGGSTDP
jgi:hypothetical protein